MIKMGGRFEFECRTEWWDNNYHTTTLVYDWTKTYPGGWNGPYFDNPAIIKAETVEGQTWSDEMSDFIHEIGATDIEEEADE